MGGIVGGVGWGGVGRGGGLCGWGSGGGLGIGLILVFVAAASGEEACGDEDGRDDESLEVTFHKGLAGGSVEWVIGDECSGVEGGAGDPTADEGTRAGGDLASFVEELPGLLGAEAFVAGCLVTVTVVDELGGGIGHDVDTASAKCVPRGTIEFEGHAVGRAGGGVLGSA